MSLTPVTEHDERTQLELLKSGLIEEGTNHFNHAWLSTERWVVVPVESASHFNERDASRLESAFRLIRCPAVFALSTENAGPGWPDFTNEPSVFAFLLDTSKQDLLEFSRACSHFNFALIPSSRSAAISCTVYEYYLVAGPFNFVETAVGGNIAAAWERFKEFAADPMWEGKLWKNVVERYHSVTGTDLH